MKWSEVRTLHPNKFVLLEKLKEHIDGNYKYIDEVALIDVIDNDKEASDLLVRCKGDRFVYHTSKEDLCMEIVNMPIFLKRIKNIGLINLIKICKMISNTISN